MLIISGSAQYILEENQPGTHSYNKDDQHTFTLFSVNENLDDNLSAIEKFLNDLGWDEILIEETHLIENSDELDHSVLKGGFDKAIKQDLAVVINNIPVTETESA